MPSLTVSWAPRSSSRSHSSISWTDSPIKSLCSACRLGRPSSIRMRSMSLSACFISPIDSSYSFLPSRPKPQWRYMRACRKYWLIAVSSLVSCALRWRMMVGSPFMGCLSYFLDCCQSKSADREQRQRADDDADVVAAVREHPQGHAGQRQQDDRPGQRIDQQDPSDAHAHALVQVGECGEKVIVYPFDRDVAVADPVLGLDVAAGRSEAGAPARRLQHGLVAPGHRPRRFGAHAPGFGLEPQRALQPQGHRLRVGRGRRGHGDLERAFLALGGGYLEHGAVVQEDAGTAEQQSEQGAPQADPVMHLAQLLYRDGTA